MDVIRGQKTTGVILVMNCQDRGSMHVAVEGQCGWHYAVKRVLLVVYRSNACDTRDHRNAFPQSITMHNSQLILVSIHAS